MGSKKTLQFLILISLLGTLVVAGVIAVKKIGRPKIDPALTKFYLKEEECLKKTGVKCIFFVCERAKVEVEVKFCEKGIDYGWRPDVKIDLE